MVSTAPTCPLSDFRPLPLLGNPHVQTLLSLIWRGPSVKLPTTRHVLRLPDGDGLMLHDTTPAGWVAGAPVAVIVHGLTANHASPGVQRLAVFLLERGVRVVRLDQRGTGAGLRLARAFYHAGRSEDVRAVLEEVHRWSPTSPLLLAGISLGGNVALKLAGEAADRPVPGLARVATLAPPIDLERCAALLAQRRNRFYERHFVRSLLSDARKRFRHFPEVPLPAFPRRMTVRRFDDLYTAPRCGFRDAADYYRRASSAPLVARINLPTLILTARDDPFIAVQPFEELPASPHVTLRILRKGGHVGFIGRDGAGGFRWAERRMAEWLTS